MAALAQRTESDLPYDEPFGGRSAGNPTMTDAISHATVQVANELKVAAIVASSETGYTARMIARYRARSRVLAVTPHEKSARRMQLYWGVEPLLGEASQTTDGMIRSTIDSALSKGLIKSGDMVVVTAGVPVGMAGSTNLINVVIVGNILLRGAGIGGKVVRGKVRVINSVAELAQCVPGEIIVIGELADEVSPHAVKAAALVTEEGGFTSPAAIVSVSFGIPAVVGVPGATRTLKTGMTVTLDAARGLIYQHSGG
jgi:pyruvate kinase